MEPRTRILVIGADGADGDLIDRWGADGDLPNLMALRGRSAWSRVRNPQGLISGSVWPTFHTGALPGNQPQYDAMRHFDAESYDFGFYAPADLAPPIWSQLSRAGKRAFVMDAPYTYADPDINGVCIVDWGTHVPASGQGPLSFAAYPCEAGEELLALVGPDPAGGLMCDDRLPETVDDYRDFIAIHRARIAKKAQAARHFLAKGGWDYFEVVFCDLHCVGHHAWHINDKNHPRYRADFEAALGEPLRDCYREFDKAAGEILALADEHTTVVFYASHGMGPQYTGTGLLDRILFNLDSGRRTEGAGRTMRGRLRALWHRVPPDIKARLAPLKRPFAGTLVHDTFLGDREHRRFFEVHVDNSEGGVRLNLKGREAKGLVEPADYDALLDDITQALKDVVNVETGEPLVAEIVRPRDLYRGPHLGRLPDLTVVWNKDHPIRVVSSPRIGTIAQEFANPRTGDHTPLGLFYATGPGVQRGALNGLVDAPDFVPTFRRLLGLAAEGIDGAPIRAIVGQSVPVD